MIYVVDEAPLMTGEDLVDAQAAFDQQTNAPVVNFTLTDRRRHASSAT